MSKELVVSGEEISQIAPMELFSEGGLDAIIEEITSQVRAHVPDLETEQGRKDIRSLARKVASTKVFLDDIGKNLVADVKQKVKIVDEERKKMRDTLDALKDEARKPLTEYETAEQQRIDALNKRLYDLEQLAVVNFGEEQTSDDIRALIKTAEETMIDESWEELQDKANEIKPVVVGKLKTNLQIKLNEEEKARLIKEQEAELEKLRKEKEQREMEEKAQAVAAQEAQRKIDEANAEKAKAEERAAQAAQAERDKMEKERLAKEAEDKAREADREHRAKINRAALDAIQKECPGFTEQQAVKILTAISMGKIPNVMVKY